MQEEVAKHYQEGRFHELEWGVYYEFEGEEKACFLFMELPYQLSGLKNIKEIPTGKYQCIQVSGDASRLDEASQLFPEVFASSETVIAIERMLIELGEMRMEIRVLGS